MKKTDSGYSLVEVIVAMGIFGAVVMSIMTLFYWGRMNVYSGKKMTEAVTVGTKVLEDLSGMTITQINAAFVLTDATTRGTVNVDGGTYTNAIRRATNTISATTELNNPNGILTRWRLVMDPTPPPPPAPQTRFSRGLVEVVLIHTQPRLVASPVTTANVLKIRVIISWNEDQRRRRFVLDTAKAENL